MARGDRPYAKARVLAPHLNDANMDPLLAIVEATPAGRLGAAIAAWCTRNEDPDVIDERQHDEHSMSWRVEPDGMVTFTFKVPLLQAVLPGARIDIEVMRVRPHENPADGSDSDAPAEASGTDTIASFDHAKSKR